MVDILTAAQQISRALERFDTLIEKAEMLEQYAAYDYEQALAKQAHGLAAIAKGQHSRAQARLHALQEARELFDE